jgi:hypothetical protein
MCGFENSFDQACVVEDIVTITDTRNPKGRQGIMNIVICLHTWFCITQLEREKSTRNKISVSEIYKRLVETINNLRTEMFIRRTGVAPEREFKQGYIPQFALNLIVRYLTNGNIFVKWVDSLHTIDETVDEKLKQYTIS